MQLDKEMLKAYENALYNQLSGSYEPMLEFARDHAEEFKLIQTMYRKRVSIKQSIEAMQLTNEPIYWFTLTFNDKRDKSNIETKRKTATKFLNEIAGLYLLVEEFGEDNNRYHIHGFLIFRYGKGFNDFVKWHSRQNIIELKGDTKIKKRVYYLTNYMVKGVPRIRRGKSLVKLCNAYKSKRRIIKDFSNYGEDVKKSIVDNFVDLF